MTDNAINLKTALRLPKILPPTVAKSKHFLLWRREWNEKRQIFVKTPYYISGRKRYGELDGPKDMAKLSSLDDALRAYSNHPDAYDGIGLAVVGDGVAAFDLDKCLTPDGELIQNHAGRYLAEKAEAEGAYIEISPSGTGLRILGKSEDPTAYSKAGLEYWGEGRYVTLTGAVWANPRGWKDLTALRETLPSVEREKKTDNDDEEETLVTRRVLEELKSALSAMSSDERTLWISMGHALKTLGEKGKELWLDWSATSDKFDEADASETWDSFQPGHTGYKAVFAEAQRNWKWENPRAGKPDAQADEVDEEDIDNLLSFAIDLGSPKLHPTEFVLDGFLPTGVSLVAGAWGAGKSTNLIPLFASVAHLTPEEWGFHPVLRRHIVWVTEAPDQARDTIYSLVQSEGSADWAEFKDWFHLVPSHRTSPKVLAISIKKAVEELTYEMEGTGFAIRPVVVLDTTSANLDLENESDNSEVGAAMSRLKEALPGVPLVLVGHTPKAITKGDVSEMTFRGAGAWEADAVATYFLVHDVETSMRFMTLGKVRFTPDYNEISFGQEGGRELVETEWGDPQSKAFMHGVPCKSTGEERKAAQAKIRDERKEAAREREGQTKQKQILEAVNKLVGDIELPTVGRIKELVAGRAEAIQEATRTLVEGGLIKVVPIPDDVFDLAKMKRGKGRVAESIYLPDEVEIDQFYARFSAHWVGV